MHLNEELNNEQNEKSVLTIFWMEIVHKITDQLQYH